MKLKLIIIFFVLLLEILGIGVLFPVLPSIVGKYSGNAVVYTSLLALYSLLMFISSPIWGYLSDRFGRKLILIISSLGLCVAYLMFSLADTLVLLFLSRALAGVFSGTITTAIAYIYDISEPENRDKNMTLVGIAYGLGFIIAPVIGGLLGSVALWLPTAFLSFYCLFMTVIIVRFLEDTKLHLDKSKPQVSLFKVLVGFSKIRNLALILIFFFIFQFSFGLEGTFLPLFFSQSLGAGILWISAILFFAGLGMTLAQVLIVVRLCKLIGEKYTIMIGMIGTSVMLGLVLVYQNVIAVTILMFISAGFSSLIFSPFNVLAISFVDEHNRGSVSGVTASIIGLTSFLAPFLGGFLVKDYPATLPLLVSVIITFVSVVVIFPIPRRAK